MPKTEQKSRSQNGFARRRENKKRDIIAAARRLFFSSTPKNVTIAELAREAKVSQVSIYNFFGSKENVIREVFFAYMNEAFETLQRVMDSDNHVEIFVSGDYSTMLSTLATCNVTSLDAPVQTLEQIFIRFYGKEGK